MFVQMIRAKLADPAGAEEAIRRWNEDLKPGAKGWLGVTSGTTKDGELVTVVRFDTEANARANSARPEQDAWWNEMSKNFTGEATFFESNEVDTFGEGGRDNAGFVQIITGRSKDKARAKQMDKEMDAAMQGVRPDVIGGIAAWNGDDFVQVIYFTSEAEARTNEAKPLEGEAKKLMDEMMSLGDNMAFIDLSTPRLKSA